MFVCPLCKKEKILSRKIGACKECLLKNWEKLKPKIFELHENNRKFYGLPPLFKKGLECKYCANRCKIPKRKLGFCGLVKNEDGKLIRLAGTPQKGLLEYYYDPLPTNCVASWICAASGKGYPKFSYSAKVETGFYNLAVFYGACSFNCLFCQNYSFKKLTQNLSPIISAEELAEKVYEKVSCVCFFGGDPSVQIVHAISFAKMVREKFEGRILRLCLETNGNENFKLLKKFAEYAFESGGTIKFDLKFWDERLNLAFCYVSNKNVYKNFEKLAEMHKERKEVPFLHASTLLIPGYVDEDEVRKIAEFIASLDTSIPYSLLAFYPSFVLKDLPLTNHQQAKKCLEVAKKAGLKNVRIGNVHLLF
jgi:pyruvate formate lyase activating enzyme